jgi:UDP-N-acetylmuramoyl-tripeptide--D-alanyl-D-alanine ligase
MRMTAAEVARCVGGAVDGEAELMITGAEVDSRLVGPGDLFVALPGERRDGHEFVDDAMDRGAAALVKEGVAISPPPRGRALIRVADPLAAYWRLARHQRSGSEWTVCAVTGSVGKTTVKEFIASLLERHRATGRTSGNRNNTLGLPAQLLSQPDDLEIFVAETGMSRPGELDVLGGILHPIAVLVYTRIAPAHTEFLGGLDGVVKAKAELLAHLDPAGTLVVNDEDPHQREFAAPPSGRVLRFGGGGEIRARAMKDRGLLGTEFELVTPDGVAAVRLELAGRHQAQNLLAAAAAAHALGLGTDQIAAGAAGLRAAPHRGRLFRRGDGVTVVDDSYNASPVATETMLELLADSTGRRVAVLGEMYELGDLSEPSHRAVGQRAARACDLLVVVGGQPARLMADAARRSGCAAVLEAEDAEQAAVLVASRLQPGDVVLVKGSRGVGLDRTVTELMGEEAA